MIQLFIKYHAITSEDFSFSAAQIFLSHADRYFNKYWNRGQDIPKRVNQSKTEFRKFSCFQYYILISHIKEVKKGLDIIKKRAILYGE